MGYVCQICDDYYLFVIVIDYCLLIDCVCVCEMVKCIKVQGVVLYVIDFDLLIIGVGCIEVLLCKVLILQDCDLCIIIDISEGVCFVVMLFNFFGYDVEYVDINKLLFVLVLFDCYVGVVVWVNISLIKQVVVLLLWVW